MAKKEAVSGLADIKSVSGGEIQRTRAPKQPDALKAELETAAANRSTRTRMRTRQKLIDAAQRVMGRKGVEGATINEITEEADVGFGSFYNHFESKDEIARAVFAARSEKLATSFDVIGASVPDVALAMSFIQRLWIETARQDPVWGWFNIHAEVALQQMDQTFRERVANDLRRGLNQGRYHFAGIDTAVTLTISSLMATMRMILDGRAKASAASEMVEFLLRMYGVPHDEAATLARHPLPKFDAKENQFGSGAAADDIRG